MSEQKEESKPASKKAAPAPKTVTLNKDEPYGTVRSMENRHRKYMQGGKYFDSAGNVTK